MGKCKNCGKKKPKSNKDFCSAICHQEWRNKNKAVYVKNCEQCGKTFSGGSLLKDVKLCSNKCARRFVGNKLSEKSLSTKPIRFCTVCNEIIPEIRGKRYNKRCSLKCDVEYKRQQKITAWLKDGTKGTAIKGGLNRAIRSYLIEEANGACERCGRIDVHPVTGNYVIEVDHIDGNRYNNSRSNLSVLCANCHSLTSTFKNTKRDKMKPVEAKQLATVEELIFAKPELELWIKGFISYSDKASLPKYLREYLMAKANYKCIVESCGWGEINPYNGKIPLEINHIDGNANNNSPENLEVLCPQCHSMTDNHRALNKNSARTSRKKL